MKQTGSSVGPFSTRALRWLAPLVWMAVIFWFSSREGDDLNGWLPWFQQWIPGMSGFDWGHFVSYFILAVAFAYAFGGASLRLRTKAVIVLLCMLYGVTDEYQSVVCARTGSGRARSRQRYDRRVFGDAGLIRSAGPQRLAANRVLVRSPADRRR
ncbi:VanZ family protein [Paenibacillus sp.]|uniref:VanZ family protein n=1 Tax=Paenibacillus sp. TaxID=58172 RepID=UPI003BEEC046